MRLFIRLFLFISACLLGITNVKAQLVPYYTFSQNNSTYIPIVGGTVYASGVGVDDNTYPVSLPFNFVFDGITYNSIYISTNGFISFGSADPLSFTHFGLSGTPSGIKVAAGFGYNLRGLDASTELSVQTYGLAPNRSFVVQWKNFTYALTTSGLLYNFQIQLNETTNTVEVMYGTMSTVINTTSGEVGLRGSSLSEFNNRSGSSWSSTSAGSTVSSTVVLSPSGMPVSGLTYKWTPPPPCASPISQPTALAISAGYSSATGTFMPSLFGADNYLVVRTPNVPMTSMPVNGTAYTIGNSLGGGEVVGTTGTGFSDFGLTMNTNYLFTVFAYNNTGCSGIAYDTIAPLTGTINTLGPRVYTWLPLSGSASYTTDTNWSPSRTNADGNDTLVFNNGGTVTVTNIPQANIGGITITNGTAVTMMSASNDSLSVQSFLDILSGSLTLTGSNVFKIAYTAGATKPARINGTLNLGTSCGYNATNSVTTITGVVNDSGVNAAMTTYCNCRSTIVFGPGGVYNHMRNGGAIPQGTYDPASVVNITGITNVAPVFVTSADVGSLAWNCPAQSTRINISNLASVSGDMRIISTGADTLACSTLTGLTVGNDLIQTGGIYRITTGTGKLRVIGNTTLASGVLDLTGNNSASVNATNLYLHGNLTQSGAHNITKSGSSASVISFTGNTHQNINISGSVINNARISYVLNNATGATLQGSLPVSSNAGNRINFGSWDGPGQFNYSATDDTLFYSSPDAITASSVEWPALNSPPTIMLNMTGTSAANQIALPGSRTVQNNVCVPRGIIVLNDHDLSVTNANAHLVIAGDTTGMIAADSTGQLILTILAFSSSTTAGSYIWPIGTIRNFKSYGPVSISYLSNSITRNVGMRSRSRQHPHDGSVNNYLAKYWTVTDDGGAAPYVFVNLSFYYVGQDLVGNDDIRMNSWDGTAWTQQSSIGGSNNISTSLTCPLNGREFTGRPSVNQVYTWTGATSTDYTTPTNWSPSRISPSTSDVLQFNNAATNIVTNVKADEEVSRVLVTNNTTAIWQGGTSSASSVYTLRCNDSTTYALKVDSGSALIINGSVNALRLGYGIGSTCRGLIAGRLELQNTGVANTVNFDFGITTVTNTGVLAAGTTNNGGSFGGTASALIINGTYEHKYTTVAGSIPTATWGANSKLLITGYTTATTGTNTFMTVPHVIYNCPAQTSGISWSVFLSTTDTFHVVSTGSGQMKLSGTFGVNNYVQDGGNVDIRSASLNVRGNFVQSAGTLFTTTTGNGVFNFMGSATQNVSFRDATPAGRIVYRVSNPAGINLMGTGTLTSVFRINNGGGIRISVPTLHPINTSFAIQYDTTESFLSYDTITSSAATAYIVDSLVFPSVKGPLGFIVNVGDNSTLTLPFSRTVPATLTMLDGDLLIGANSLTVGRSAVSTGYINWWNGYIVPTTGTLTRWYSASGVSTSPGTTFGYYPLKYGGANRSVSLYFNNSLALTTGGTISVAASNVPGFTTGLSVADGATTITSQANSSWTFTTGNGIAMSGTIGMRLTGGSLYTFIDPAKLHVMHAGSIVGNHVTGSGTVPDLMASRTGMSLADVTTSPLYIGTPDTLLTSAGAYISVANGNWTDTATWNLGVVPPVGSTVIIANGTTVTVNGGACVAKVLTVNFGSTLTGIAGGDLHVDSTIINNGILSIAANTLVLGPAGGGNRRFTNNGTLNVTSGRLDINGRIVLTPGSIFNQSGGDINVDGNAGGVAANSIGGVAHMWINDAIVNASAGNLRFIDPNVGGGVGTGLYITVSGSGVNFSGTHNIIFGDGISTTPGPTFEGFSINSTTPVNNIIVNGSPAGANRRVYGGGSNLIVKGDITLTNANAEFSGGSALHVFGNIYAAAGSYVYLPGFLFFDNPLLPQSVNGPGIYRNTWIGVATSNFTQIVVNNGSAAGVTLNMTDPSFSDFIIFQSGKIHAASGALVNNGTYYNLDGSQSTGWVTGKYRAKLIASTTPTVTFPIGDSLYYAPVHVAFPGGAILNGGDLTIETTPADHPAIASSNIIPSQSVNRYYTVDTSAGLRLASYSTVMTVNWAVADEDPALNWSDLISSTFRSGTWIENTVTAAIPNSAVVTNIGNNIAGAYQVGTRSPAPFVTLQPVNRTICQGTNTTFSTAASIATGFQWQVNNGSGWVNVVNSSIYSGAATTILSVTAAPVSLNGYLYRCSAYNTTDTSYTASATLTVNTTVTPSVTTTLSGSDTLCAGNTASFTATGTNGGTSPLYRWTVNGVSTAYGSVFNHISPANNDTVRCIMTSNATCLSSVSGTSASTLLTVRPLISPSVAIAAADTTICAATLATFSAAASNAGTTPHYQWKKNGINVGIDSTGYANAALSNGDLVTCIVTSSYACASPLTATGNIITMTVNPVVIPVANIIAGTGDTICLGTTTTFTATTNITGGTYQWSVNSAAISGATNMTYTQAPANGDIISWKATAPVGSCYTPDTVVSNTVAMVVNPYITPLVTITGSDTVCITTSDLYTATGNVPGASFAWLVNGSIADTGIAYTYAPVNLDEVKCVLTVPAVGCFNQLTDTSNAINMTVMVDTLPVMIITTLYDTVCAGTSITLTGTANVSVTGYQWFVNSTSAGSAGSYTYTPVNGDTISCVITVPAIGCYTMPTDTSNKINMVVDPILTPTVSINGATTLCSGTSVVYTTSTNVSPATWHWSVNGSNDSTNSSYTYMPVNGDILSCTVTATGGCYATPTASASKNMIVTTSIVPVVSITATDDSICAGTLVNYTATSATTGATYVWQVNGINKGTGASYAYAPVGGDTVKNIMTVPTSGCYTVNKDTSNIIIMSVDPIISPVISIAASDTAVLAGDAVNLVATVTNAGTTYMILWTKNSSLLDTTTVPHLNYIKGAGADTITAQVLSTSVGCYSVASYDTIYIYADSTATSSDDISVYPNPFNVQISIKGLKVNDKIQLYDMAGRNMQEEHTILIQEKQYDFSMANMPSGQYILKIVRSDGSRKSYKLQKMP